MADNIIVLQNSPLDEYLKSIGIKQTSEKPVQVLQPDPRGLVAKESDRARCWITLSTAAKTLVHQYLGAGVIDNVVVAAVADLRSLYRSKGGTALLYVEKRSTSTWTTTKHALNRILISSLVVFIFCTFVSSGITAVIIQAPALVVPLACGISVISALLFVIVGTRYIALALLFHVGKTLARRAALFLETANETLRWINEMSLATGNSLSVPDVPASNDIRQELDLFLQHILHAVDTATSQTWELHDADGHAVSVALRRANPERLRRCDRDDENNNNNRTCLFKTDRNRAACLNDDDDDDDDTVTTIRTASSSVSQLREDIRFMREQMDQLLISFLALFISQTSAASFDDIPPYLSWRLSRSSVYLCLVCVYRILLPLSKKLDTAIKTLSQCLVQNWTAADNCRLSKR